MPVLLLALTLTPLCKAILTRMPLLMLHRPLPMLQPSLLTLLLTRQNLLQALTLTPLCKLTLIRTKLIATLLRPLMLLLTLLHKLTLIRTKLTATLLTLLCKLMLIRTNLTATPLTLLCKLTLIKTKLIATLLTLLCRLPLMRKFHELLAVRIPLSMKCIGTRPLPERLHWTPVLRI